MTQRSIGLKLSLRITEQIVFSKSDRINVRTVGRGLNLAFGRWRITFLLKRIEAGSEKKQLFRKGEEEVQCTIFISFYRRNGNNLYFMQLFFNKPNKPNLCPIFKWSTNHFDLVDELPCRDAMKMELFDIESDIYIALANNKDEFGKSRSRRVSDNIFLPELTRCWFRFYRWNWNIFLHL